MSPAFLSSHIIFILVFSVIGRASPLSGYPEIAERDNEWNLKCSNAPTVVAGSLLNASDVTTPLPKVLPESGSDQPWFKYLWCVPGTKTYLFLNNGRLEPPPLTWRDVGGALNDATLIASEDLRRRGDGPIQSRYNGYMTPDFSWYSTTPWTNIEVFVQPSKGVLTWGILVSALTGLGQYVGGGYNFGSMPMVFQVNDAQWGEVGIGYVGFIDPDDTGSCIIQQIQGDLASCDDVKQWKVIR